MIPVPSIHRHTDDLRHWSLAVSGFGASHRFVGFDSCDSRREPRLAPLRLTVSGFGASHRFVGFDS